MENKIININFRTSNYTARNEILDGRNYLVVPVIMMQDGVHSGSMGPLYHSITELGKPDWNNIPIVINHPKEGDNYVSANSECVKDHDKVGIIRNTRVEGPQLKAEAWLDITKMTAYQPDLLHRINGGEIINVSVGVFTDVRETQLVMDDGSVVITNEAINHIPDHLAILPFDRGACSTEDGCGIRVNSKSENKLNINDNVKGGQLMTKQDVFKELITYKKEDMSSNELNQLLESVKPLNLGLLSTNVCAECLQINEVGILERVNLIRRFIDNMDNGETMYYLEDVSNDNTIVYRIESRNQRRGSSLYKQKYTINDSGVVAFDGEPISVVKKVSYEIAVNMKRTKFNVNEKGGNEMAKVNELAAGLIAHVGTNFVEADKVWLETLSEEQLTKMVPKEVKKEVQTNAVEQLSAEDKSALEFGKQQLKAHRDGLVQKIVANTAEGVWDTATLNNMSNDTLERIANSIPVKEVPNTTGVYINSGVSVNVSKEAPLYPAGIEMETK